MADAGIRLTIEGEKEFRAALKECDAAVKENQKALKLLTEEYKLNDAGMKDATSGFGSMADAAEILTTKGKVLADSIEVQTEKVGLLDARMQEATEAYGEHDRRTQELRAQLLEASTALAKLTAEQERNRQAILDAQNSTREYDDAVKALEAQLAANEAELKAMGGGLDALQKEYAETEKASGSLGKSTEDLQKKEENLRKQNENLAGQNGKLSDSISKQQALVDNLSKAQETAAKRYGEGSKEAEAYRKKLAEAAGQLDAMERELRENEQAIRDNNTAIEQGGDAPNPMLEGLSKIEEMTGVKIPAGIKEMIGGFDGGTLAVGGIVGALAGVAAKMAGIYKEALGWARDLTTSAQELDLGTGEYQALEYAATKAGFPVDYFRQALEKVNKKAAESDEILGEWVGRMDELKYASDNTKEAVAEQMKYWDDLGVALYDNEGNLKSTHDLMYDIIDAMGKMETKAEKDRAAMDIFGEKFSTVNPLIQTGVEQLRAFEEEAWRTGVVLDDELVEKLNKSGAAFDTFGMRVDSAKKRLAANFSWQDLIPGWNQIRSLGHLGDLFGTLFGISGKYASGTNYAPGGLALVGERGPEIVDLPRGSKVYPNGIVPAGLSGGSTVNESNVYNITIDAASVEEFNDIVRIARGARVGMRRG